MLDIREDDLTSQQTRELLEYHVRGMHDSSPPGTCFVLDLSGLQVPEVTVWSAWDNGRIAGIGALKVHPDGTGEVKSMRTHPDYLGKGVGRAILERIIETAMARGIPRLSLETGTGELFEAALTLYRNRGFVEGEPFADYVRSDFNRYFHMDL